MGVGLGVGMGVKMGAASNQRCTRTSSSPTLRGHEGMGRESEGGGVWTREHRPCRFLDTYRTFN